VTNALTGGLASVKVVFDFAYNGKAGIEIQYIKQK
jgi:hypothetical protein